MQKIKVAQFVGSMNCGGTETMLMNVFKKFNKDKYEFTFIVNINEKGWYDDEILAHNGNIVRIKKIEEIGAGKYIKYLTKIFKDGNYDVIHSHTFLHSGFVMKAAKNAGIKIRIAHSHSAMDHFEKNLKYKLKKLFLQKMIIKNASHIIACSTEAGECLFGEKFKKKGIVLKNPVRIQEIENIASDIENINNLKEKYNIMDGQLVIGHIGRFVDIKNHKFLLQIAKEMKKRNIQFKMFFIGDGENFENIKNQVDELNLDDCIVFTGNIKNVYEYINIFDIFLLPSLYEGLPLTAIEAQGFDVKCLISDKVSREVDLGIGLVNFLSIDDGVNIWIDKILESDYKKRNIENSIEALHNNGYSIESVIKTLEEIYNK